MYMRAHTNEWSNVRVALLLFVVVVGGLFVYLFATGKLPKKKKEGQKGGGDNVKASPTGVTAHGKYPREPFPKKPEKGAQTFDASGSGPGSSPPFYKGDAEVRMAPEASPNRLQHFESGRTEQGIPTLKAIPRESQKLPPGYGSRALASASALSASASHDGATSFGEQAKGGRALGTNGQVYAVKQGRTCSAVQQHNLIDMVLDTCEAYCGHDNQCIGFNYNYANGTCLTYADCPSLKDHDEESRVFVKMPSRRN